MLRLVEGLDQLVEGLIDHIEEMHIVWARVVVV
jgi:hypothetical protein